MAPIASMNRNLDDDFERDIDALIRDQQQNRATFDLDRDELNIYRSGSAPPTVEGSRTAFGSLFAHGGISEVSRGVARGGAGSLLSEDEMRSHPAYLSYYYSNENLNPRMPPPAVSKEDWRARQRAAAFGKIGDKRRTADSLNIDESNSSLFSSQPGFPMHHREFDMVEPNNGMLQHSRSQHMQSGEWLHQSNDGLIGLPDVGIGLRRKSFADVLQDEIGRQTYDIVDPIKALDSQATQLHNGLEGLGKLQSGASSSSLVRVQSLGSSISNSFASGLGSSVSRSATPDPLLIQRSPSPCLPPVGPRNMDNGSHNIVGSNGFGGVSSNMGDRNDIAAVMSGLNLSKNIVADEKSQSQRGLNDFSDQQGLLFDMPTDKRQVLQRKVMTNSESELIRSPNNLIGHDMSEKNDDLSTIGLNKITSNGQIQLPKQSPYPSTFKKVYPEGTSSVGSNIQHQNVDLSSIELSGTNPKSYGGFNGLPAMLNNQLETGQYLNVTGNQAGSGFQVPFVDSLYPQYLNGTSDTLLHGATSLDPSVGRNFLGASQIDLPDYQNAYLGALLSHEKLQYGMPLLSKSSALNTGFYGNHNYGYGMPFPGSPISSVVRSSLSSHSPGRQNERLSHNNSAMRGVGGESMGSWNLDNAALEESSLLEEFKSNKGVRSFELSDIVGHVVEFSGDQYGSRFIQQKLETASVEEKNNIFREILPKAHSLMTDVFGNYVIQKFFEHGTEVQRKQLASQLTGHVLPLSLQMYGCRVIQKALEVVDVDQQTQMVLELDGNIMKCVRDQNGNHVIQKCIECVPQEKIRFIIEAFYGHVVSLSTHPYGCRVIQRVLEHCSDPKTQSIMMDEILQSVCTLAQDQYGNYVIQHVLQHGKPEERTSIISKLSGQIIKMSQQKYASNVIEKCLSFGTTDERQLLINEMLGTTDENEPLQAMMKDQFGNYVVQKVLETCDDHNRELILSRIKVHLNALKKYTYGKHIVARVEKLVAAGERRIGLSSYSS